MVPVTTLEAVASLLLFFLRNSRRGRCRVSKTPRCDLHRAPGKWASEARSLRLRAPALGVFGVIRGRKHDLGSTGWRLRDVTTTAGAAASEARLPVVSLSNVTDGEDSRVILGVVSRDSATLIRGN